jgi:hypothetical protein
METNLDSMFKSDESCEKEGIVMDFGKGITFTVRRFGGFNSAKIREKVAKKNKPYAFQIQQGTLDEKISEKLSVEVCLVNWSGVVVDGAEAPFSQEMAVKLMLARPELYNKIFDFASTFDNYKADVGNS